MSSELAIYDASLGDRRPAGLIKRYGDLYSIHRLETLDDLDTIEELRDAEELKNKLLFSVVVVSLFTNKSLPSQIIFRKNSIKIIYLDNLTDFFSYVILNV